MVATADGTPCFCVDYRTTVNKFLVQETWPMPDIESHIDTVGGAKFIRVRHIECLLANTCSEERLSQNSIRNLERQIRFQGLSLWHRECTLDIPTCHVPCVRQFWLTEWPVGICGRCHRVFCDMGSSPHIIRGYVSRTSNSRPDIATIQDSFWTKGSSVPWACFVRRRYSHG